MIEFKNCKECPNIEVAKPFVLKTVDLFETEFSMNVQEKQLIHLEHPTKVNSINFISHLSGALNAHLIFSFDRNLAQKLLDNFPYIEYEAHMAEEMMIETVGEFLNIVIGNAMGEVQSPTQLSFSPPLGISGDSTLYCDKNSQTCKIKLVLEEGEMLIIFSTNTKEK